MMKNITRRGFFGFVGAALASVAASRLPKVEEPVTFEVAEPLALNIESTDDLVFYYVNEETLRVDDSFSARSETPTTLLRVDSSSNVGIGSLDCDIGELPLTVYPNNYRPVEQVSQDKICAYCGNANAPDARKCCGCQHAI